MMRNNLIYQKINLKEIYLVFYRVNKQKLNMIQLKKYKY